MDSDIRASLFDEHCWTWSPVIYLISLRLMLSARARMIFFRVFTSNEGILLLHVVVPADCWIWLCLKVLQWVLVFDYLSWMAVLGRYKWLIGKGKNCKYWRATTGLGESFLDLACGTWPWHLFYLFYKLFFVWPQRPCIFHF